MLRKGVARCVVPLHRELKRGTLGGVLRQAAVTPMTSNLQSAIFEVGVLQLTVACRASVMQHSCEFSAAQIFSGLA